MRRPGGGSEIAPLQSDGWSKAAGKKDTKRWCKGKVGREHDYQIVVDMTHPWAHDGPSDTPPKCEPYSKHYPHRPLSFWCNHIMKCSRCGKELYGANFVCPDTGIEVNKR